MRSIPRLILKGTIATKVSVFKGTLSNCQLMQQDGDEEDDEEEVISLFLSSIVLHVKLLLAAPRTIIWHATIFLMKVFIVKEEEEEVKLLSGGGVLLAFGVVLLLYLFESGYKPVRSTTLLRLKLLFVRVVPGARRLTLEGLIICLCAFSRDFSI